MSSCAASCCFEVDSDGFHFDGGVGLRMSWPNVVHLPLVIHSLATSVAISGSDFPITVAGTIVVSLGPLTVTIEGFGIAQPLRLTTDGSGNLGILDLPPPSFTADGDRRRDRRQRRQGRGFPAGHGHADRRRASSSPSFSASLELSIQALGDSAEINGELSFIVAMSVRFSPAIEIFLGLRLNAVGGVFGLNRTVDSTSLRALIRDGHAKDVLIPDDLIARTADLVLAGVATPSSPQRSASTWRAQSSSWAGAVRSRSSR